MKPTLEEYKKAQEIIVAYESIQQKEVGNKGYTFKTKAYFYCKGTGKLVNIGMLTT